jgi:rubrerythrin
MSDQVSRTQFLTRGAALAGAATTLAAFGPLVRRAGAAGGNVDLRVLQFALLLERLEADYYRRAVKEAPLSGATLSVARDLADNESQHVDALEQLVRQLDGRSGRAPRFDFGGAFTSEQRFLTLARSFEDTGVSAYNGAAPLIENDDILEAAGMIVQVEARHAARIRMLTKNKVAPVSFDPALTMDQVMKRISPYIKTSR